MRRCAQALLLGLAVGTAACQMAEEKSSPAASQGNQAVADLTFTQWCAEWGLTCGDAEPPAEGFTKAKYDATMAIVSAGLRTDSTLTLTAEQIAQANLQNALASMELTNFLAPFFQFLNDVGFRDASLDGTGDRLVAKLADAAAYTTRSGLNLNLSGEVSATLAPMSTLSGMRLGAAAGGASDDLKTFGVGEDDLLIWAGDTYRVSAVPLGFLPREIGLDFGELPAQSKLLYGLGDMVDWLAGVSPHVQLSAGFLDVVATQADVLVEDAQNRSNLQTVVGAMEHVGAKALDAHTLAVGITNDGGRTVSCKSDGSSESEIQLAGGYGVETLSKFEDGARFRFYGMKVKSKVFGPIRASFNLKRVDVYGDRAVVRDIPVIGTYTIRFDEQNPLVSENWSCS